MGPCIESTRTPSQYAPQVRRRGRTMPEARWLWEQVHGPIPPRRFICHHCDNPRCINLDHLYLGTPKSNMEDRLRRGRNPNATKTHCAQGHPFDEKNTYRKPNGWRVCRECRRQGLRRLYTRRAA